MLGGGGDCSVTNVPSGTGRGYLDSGGKPAGLLRQKGVAVLVGKRCLQGRMRSRDRWARAEVFVVHWQRKQNQ